eukprot:comp19378_c0_seq2/m.22347 comp19378_c0_seq2/g.22347  ORF comp19378_c0_seq2/g.22347 comp19378_c0_seq2/m.22347 type:complete len:511 (-) comp19378_c0_seq2:119-1651(-)
MFTTTTTVASALLFASSVVGALQHGPQPLKIPREAVPILSQPNYLSHISFPDDAQSLSRAAMPTTSPPSTTFPNTTLPIPNNDNNLLDAQARIVGGHIVSTAPRWMVSLQTYKTDSAAFCHICGGSLIAPNLVVTAGHCLGAFNRACLGGVSFNHSNDFNCYEIDDFFAHPSWNATTLFADVALVRLKTSVPNPTLLPLNRNPQAGNLRSPVVVLGWGVDETNTVSGVLKSLDETVIGQAECSVWEPPVETPVSMTKICTYSNFADSSACAGDSGGPLLNTLDPLRASLVGIVSFGGQCGQHTPNVYTRIGAPEIHQWIDSIANGLNGSIVGWGAWSGWSVCDCNSGKMSRNRNCNGQLTQCVGVAKQMMPCAQTCNAAFKPNISAGEWSNWGPCNCTANQRRRDCKGPGTKGNICSGSPTEFCTNGCTNPRLAGTSECSVTCGGGVRSDSPNAEPCNTQPCWAVSKSGFSQSSQDVQSAGGRVDVQAQVLVLSVLATVAIIMMCVLVVG